MAHPTRVSCSRWLLAALAASLLGACGNPLRFEDQPAAARPPATAPPVRPAAAPRPDRPQFHVVRKGETLYSIAFRYGLATAQVAAWNGLGDGSLIRVGQRLRLWPPGTAVAPAEAEAGQANAPPAAVVAAPAWRWPASGPVVGRYGDSPMTASGIQIGGRLGDPVSAAAGGQVVYAGSGLVSYGELLIIKHNESWLSAYGFNQAILVREGERVAPGQVIARLGEGPGRQPMLHFEIRRNGAPVNPQSLLPPRP